MEKRTFERPSFDDALKVWQDVLKQAGFPTQCAWLFGENLCFERDPAKPDGFSLCYQTRFTPVPADAERVAYGYFSDFAAPLVFYRLGSAGGTSLCLLLCDEWFNRKTDSEGIVRRGEWLILFRPGSLEAVQEIRDINRYQQRVLRDRPLHDLDFCMTLRGVHEILAHGRVLTSYERYALRLLHVWRRIMGDPH